MNFVDIYQKYWKNGYTLTDLSLSGIDREVFRSLFNPVAEVFRKYPAGDCHLYTFGPGVPILGPELVVNGDGATVTGWTGANATVSVQAGEICNTGIGPLYPEILQDFGTVAGREYLVTGSSRRGTSANPAWVLAKRKLGAANLTSSTANSSQVSAPFSFKFVAQDDQSRISLVQSSGTADTGTVLFDNISVREILGYSNTYSGFVAGNYFDSAGTALASLDGSVGLVLDAAGSVGAEMIAGNWSSTAEITVAGVDQNCTLTYTNASAGAATNNIGGGGFAPNKTYKVTYTVLNRTAGSVYFQSTAGGYVGQVRSANGTYSEIIQPTGTASQWVIKAYDQSTSCQVTGISVKEITGIHATQSTPGFKPTERKGIVNLLTWSNDLTNASSWFPSASSVSTNVLKPDTSNNIHRVMHTGVGITSGVQYTAAIRASANGYRYLYVNGAASGGKGQACFDLVAGTIAAIAEGSATIHAVGDGTYMCCVSSTSSAAQNFLYLQGNDSALAGDTVFVGDGISGINIVSAGLFAGTLTAAQILAAGGIPLTTTAPASSVAGVNYLEFDRVDDRLSLSAPLFQMADDHCVVAGVMSNFAGDLTIFEVGDGVTSARVCSMRINASDFNCLWHDGVTAAGRYTSGGGLGSTFIASARKAGTTYMARRNAGQSSQSGVATLNSTTSTVSAIGGRTNNAEFHKGSIHCVLAIKGTVSDADLLVLEKFVAQLSGVTL